MSNYLTYLTWMVLTSLFFLVVCFYVANYIESKLRRNHRAKQIKAARKEMQRQYEGYMRAVAYNKQLINELNKQ